jgi:hypothetical protein
MGKNQDPDPGSESGMNNPDHISASLENFFWVKILKFFNADPGSEMENLDPGWKQFGSGTRDEHPGSATLLFGINTNNFRYLRGSSKTRGQLFHSREQNSPQAGTRNMIRLCLKGQCHKMDIFLKV